MEEQGLPQYNASSRSFSSAPPGVNMARMDVVPPERIEKAILLIRGQKVLLDKDLAELYAARRALPRRLRGHSRANDPTAGTEQEAAHRLREGQLSDGGPTVRFPMNQQPNGLVVLLSEKTPEAMYDALHARRCLSDDGLRSPQKVIDLIKTVLRSSRRRPLMPATCLERIAKALVHSNCLNTNGIKLYKLLLEPAN
jgi:hypothetical protein